MNQKEIIKFVHDAFDETIKSKVEAERIVKAIFGEIRHAIIRDEPVSIPGFGKFVVIERKARRGVNPQTGESIQIPASKTVKFKVSKSLKEDVN